MSEDLPDGNPVGLRNLQHLCNQFAEWSRTCGLNIDTLAHSKSDIERCFSRKRKSACHHSIENDTHAPNIHFRSEIGFLLEDSRSGVVWAPTGLQAGPVFRPFHPHPPIDDGKL